MKTITKVFDSVKIVQVIALWFISVLTFGMIYFLSNGLQQLQITTFGDAMYFSFVTSLTIGYGELVKNTPLQILTIVEALISVLLFGLLIVKISLLENKELKQEIKNLTFEESSNNVISKLYLFRNELKQLKKPEELELALAELNSAVSSLNTLADTIGAETSEKIVKQSMHVSLMTNSLNISLSRLVELLEKFNKKWKKESITSTIEECDKAITQIATTYRNDSKVEEKLKDLNKTLEELKKLSKA